MDPIMKTYLAGLVFGEMQTFKNMAVVPLFTPGDGRPEYMMLKDALNGKQITITEINRGGSVPELKVINHSNRFVLLLDGEEVMGAKQNRVLNTSILIQGESELTVPVSCTEQGRWRHTSDMFSYSDTVMSPDVRAKNIRSVSASYMMGQTAVSDQSEVWSEIASLHADMGTSSRTGAMREAYTSKNADLDSYVEAFPSVSNQQGCLVFLNGVAMGLDVLSREDAYQTVHDQLIKSYAMDALRPSNGKVTSPFPEHAETFRGKAEQCRESRFESPGVGHDYRFDGNEVIGSALVYGGHVIHAAFFKTDGSEEDVRMSGLTDRRRFRQ